MLNDEHDENAGIGFFIESGCDDGWGPVMRGVLIGLAVTALALGAVVWRIVRR